MSRSRLSNLLNDFVFFDRKPRTSDSLVIKTGKDIRKDDPQNRHDDKKENTRSILKTVMLLQEIRLLVLEECHSRQQFWMVSSSQLWKSLKEACLLPRVKIVRNVSRFNESNIRTKRLKTFKTRRGIIDCENEDVLQRPFRSKLWEKAASSKNFL